MLMQNKVSGNNACYLIDIVRNKKGKYVHNQLGKGGEGTVYSAKRTKDRVSVAIKYIAKEKVTDWEIVQDQQVPMELALLKRLSHIPSVIQLLDWVEQPDYFLLILEHPKRCLDLFTYISKHGPLPEWEAQYMMIQVLQTVKSCHSAGVIHRDIKFENILVTYDEQHNLYLKLIDFGFGAIFQKGQIYTNRFGTKVFSPPEWFRDKYYEGESATVWSLGILLYSLVVGNTPFQDSKQILEATYKIPQHLYLSNGFHAFLNWCLQVRPQDRPTLDQMYNHPWLKPLK